MRHWSVVAALCAGILVGSISAQGCASSGTFWKRDSLPITPTGLTAVSVIPGMCEGESAGVVFEMPANMPVQRITQVVVPWGAPLGVGGFQAALDVEVYDGVSFSGATVNMGTQVFSLSQVSTSNLQVQSHALNTLDTSTYNIIVGAAAPTGSPAVRRFAICFRTEVNFHPTGTCATGWPANFFTDNAQQPSFPFACNPAITPQRTSLIEIQGQGWRDAALATVTGIPLCPIYYSGVWCIRCCSEDAFPAFYQTFGTGCPSSAGVSQLINATLPRLGQTMFVIVNNLPLNLGLMALGNSNQNSSFGPLPVDMTGFGITNCFLRVSPDLLTTLVGGGGTASYSLAIPNANNLLGLQLHQQPFVFDVGLNPFGGALGNAATFQIGN
ncbi:MAG: hypothetical protein MUC36_23595 [Planctomycetes bacterium]|jgi:hypothetical protein|nr:hypothetical protein [Planctomycetota bacterium]